MPNYLRYYSGNTWFFTVVTYNRRQILTSDQARGCLRRAIIDCRQIYPFKIVAWVLLRDHLHCIWNLPGTDLNYSRRWSIIKRKFSQLFINDSIENKPPFWQKRFWAHLITDEKDYEDHLNYIHFNPVKHGLVKNAVDWSWTSLPKFISGGKYDSNWGEGVVIPEAVGRE
jgi:putative transposase